VAILRARANVILGVPGASQFRVTHADSLVDVALIAVDVDEGLPETALPVLRLRPGDAGRLSWGSFVYVLGYPRGHPMVTRAIVSNPRSGAENSFLLDGLFNRGISGGLVVAVRGDTGQLEWVGVATGASAHVEQVLVPEHRVIDEQGVLLPYTGRLFIEETRRIDYGITFSVPINAVQRFLREAGQPLPW
jgi:S1-C subfamily serine protease